jgi:hypothetical protein
VSAYIKDDVTVRTITVQSDDDSDLDIKEAERVASEVARRVLGWELLDSEQTRYNQVKMRFQR